MKNELQFIGLNEYSLLGILADIRESVGDPTGNLMQHDLVEHCRKLVHASEIIEVIQSAINKIKVPESCEGKMRGEYVKIGIRMAVEAINAAIEEHKRVANIHEK